MIQEDKELLLKDLCARLPYGIIIHLVESNEDEELYCLNIPQEGLYTRSLEHNNVTTLSPIECIKPYLRPMSSMTEEEKDTYDTLTMCNAPWVVNDWLNAHHFDYRGLIEKGLALEAPEGMYNIKRIITMNTKICTSIEQSKKLLSLGLNPSTADMCWIAIDNDESFDGSWEVVPKNSSIIATDDKPMPCWSLSALLRLMPNFNMFKRTIECRIETINHLIDKACDPTDAAFEMTCWLIEQGHIK